jgi:Leucine-rich repeat (LRR) protein
VSDCSISEIPPTISQLVKLRELRLWFNQLADVPAQTLLGMSALQKLVLGGNQRLTLEMMRPLLEAGERAERAWGDCGWRDPRELEGIDPNGVDTADEEGDVVDSEEGLEWSDSDDEEDGSGEGQEGQGGGQEGDAEDEGQEGEADGGGSESSGDEGGE